MHEKIATIINYCSNDSLFLKPCIEEAKKFSHQIIVVTADHFFDNTEEDLNKLNQQFSSFDGVDFIIYPFIPKKIFKRIYSKVKKSSLFHSLSRYLGFHHLKKNIEWVLFLDVDEIIDADRFLKWLSHPLSYDAIRLANYWYFRKVTLRAKMFEDSVIFVRKNKIRKKSLLDTTERDAIFNKASGSKSRMVFGLDGLPMVHHYSWVRSKEQLLKKVSTWGHKRDRHWKKLIEIEFENENSSVDFVHGYDLNEVDPFIKLEEIKFQKQCKSNKKILSEKELLDLIKRRSLKDFFWCKMEEWKRSFLSLIKRWFF